MQTTEAIRAAAHARRALNRASDDLADAEAAAGLRPAIGTARLVAVSLVAIAAVVLAVSGVVGWVRAADAYTDADFVAAARGTVELLLSPDAASPQRAREILDGATGQFYDDFGRSAQAYTAFVRRNNTVATAVIDASGVSTRTDTAAVVLIAASVQYQESAPAGAGSAPATAPPAQRFRLRVAVTDESSKLKVSAVQYLR